MATSDIPISAARARGGTGSGILRRRLPYVVAVLALALGYGVGQAVNDGGTAKAQAPLVTPAQINNAVASSGHGATGADRGFALLENGVQHSHAFEQPVDPATRLLLAHQMDLTRQVALQYPTLADAERAGLRRAGPFSPGLGTHMISYGNYARGATTAPMNDDQIRHPLAWIYDGTKPTSPVAGLFYSSMVPDPAGFAGTNDVWHQHRNICLTHSADGGIDAPLGADHDATKAQCDAVGGNLLAATGPLLHVWTVPGYEDSQGVFAHLNPAIACNDGTYFTVDPTALGTRLSACRDGSE